jgi:arsenate reductase
VHEQSDPFLRVEDPHREKTLAFREAFKLMDMRIKLFLSLPVASIDRIRLKQRLDAIGQTPSEADDAA